MKKLSKASLEKKYNLNMKRDLDYFTKEHHWLPKKLGVRYLAFARTLYCDRHLTSVPDHEFLHIAQFRKFGVHGVLAHYLYHFTKNYFSNLNLAQAFVTIPFEIEARLYEETQKG